MKELLRKFNSLKGFSLLEVLVGLGIFIIASLAVTAFIIQSSRSQNFSLEQSLAIAEARRSLEKFVQEVREAQIADNGSYLIVTAEDQQFTFYSDIDSDQAVERIRYYLDGTDFKKGIIEPKANKTYPESDEVITTISKFVRNNSEPIFLYYNSDWPQDTVNNPLPTPANVAEVRLVHISLKINVAPERSPNDFILESDAHIRNLKDNL